MLVLWPQEQGVSVVTYCVHPQYVASVIPTRFLGVLPVYVCRPSVLLKEGVGAPGTRINRQLRVAM